MGSRSAPSPDAIALGFARALQAAREFEGATAPNPPVGCAVLAADGRLLAVAAHRKAGEPHAEALAIAQCRALGLIEAIHTLVVTLEPCNHSGRTPPCTEAILSTPARELWIGATDPNPRVAGGGAARLRQAGLDLGAIADLDHPDAAQLAAAAERLIAPFSRQVRTGLPWVTVKQAVDAKGSMIPPPGQKTFAAPASLVFAHQLRRRADAILTGSGTVLADRPLFTVRHVPDFAGKVRHLVILDRRGRVPADYVEAARQRGFSVIIAKSIPDALHRLGEAGALEVLVEAGPLLTAAVLQTELWDEHVRITVGAANNDRIETRRRTSSSPTHIEGLPCSPAS